MLSSLPFVLSAPRDSLLYSGEYSLVLVGLSIAIAVIASYAALLVSRKVSLSASRATRYSWLVIGSLCLGVGIWSMHFVGMLAFRLPCTTSYDPLLTGLSTVPSILASMLAIKLMSLGNKPTRLRLALGGLLIGSGIGAMHYAGMAALRLNGVIRYDLALFIVSILVAVLLAVIALWIQFGRSSCSTARCTWLSAFVLGLAVSGMHYTAMSAAYFVRGDSTSAAGQGVSPTFLAAIVLSLTSLIVLLTIVSTLISKLNCKTYSRLFGRVGLTIACWLAIAWFSSAYYSETLSQNHYQRETRIATQKVEIVASGIEESLDSLISVPSVLADDSDILHALHRFNARSADRSYPVEKRKRIWTTDSELATLSDRLNSIAKVFKADVLWVMSASGDCIASSNRGMADSFVGSNYADRTYFRLTEQGMPGSQYAVGRTSNSPGLYFSYPVLEKGRFLGAVIVKRNITHFSTWLKKVDAFLLDANGVIVLASNPAIEFHAMPDAKALHMGPDEIWQQYKLDMLELAVMRPWEQERFPLAWLMHGNTHPTTLISRPVAGNTMSLYVAHPLEDLRRHDDEQYWLFLLIFAAGCMLIIAVSSIILFLRKSRETEANLRIAATAFDSQEGMVITDADNIILRVNQAFTEITGYTPKEAVGGTPRLLSSGRHDRDFYNAMWESIDRSGHWKGEIWNRRKNGEVYPELLTITAVKTSDGAIANYVGSLTDITKNKQAEDEIRKLAFFDPLTSLPNRRLLLDRLEQSIIASARGHRHGALLFIDLDNFKSLNDTLGHDVGDMLLIQVAERLKRCIRDGDTVARLGGDEFVVVLEELSSELSEAASQTELVGEKILVSLNTPYQLYTHSYLSTPSIGATLFFGRKCATEELMKQADIAMYQAKKSGRNTLRFFDPAMQTLVTAHVQMESDLRDAITRGNQLKLYFQPQVDSTGRIVGAEALVRWHQPEKGLISPANFIPLAEETGLILPLGHWVLETACAQLADWGRSPSTAGLTIAVNISAKQFNMPSFVDEVLVLLDRYSIAPSRLKLEITEGILLHNIEEIITKMKSLKTRGINFSIDDFGTGYSSLRYLKDLPLDQLKIDQSFVRDIVDKANSRAIIKTIIAMSSSLNMEVIAEGVETQEQRDILIDMGCMLFQGYLFGKPQPIEAWRTPAPKDIT